MHRTIIKLTLAALFFVSLNGFAQGPETSRLAKALRNHTEADTARVGLLNALASRIYTTDPEKALQLLDESKALAGDLHYPEGEVYCYLLLGKVYGEKKAYGKAIDYVSEGSALASKYGLAEQKKALFMLLSELNYDKSEAKNDTTLTEEVRDIKAAIKYKYFLKDSLDKTQKNASLLKKEVETKKNELLFSKFQEYLWMAGFLMLVIFFCFIFTLLTTRKIKIENKQLLTEQKLLRSQMNPHFIFNSIQNIRNLISHKKDAEAIDYLNRFSRLTRQVLESSNENYISLAEELELLDNYTALQQLLYNRSFEYSITADDTIDPDSVFIPPMLTQPFIENAIKHGLRDTTANGLITVRFRLKTARLFFEIADNGSGIVAGGKKTNHKSLAVSITAERLAHYHKRKKVDIRVHNILDTDKNIVGAGVIFEIPYIYEK